MARRLLQAEKPKVDPVLAPGFPGWSRDAVGASLAGTPGSVSSPPGSKVSAVGRLKPAMEPRASVTV